MEIKSLLQDIGAAAYELGFEIYIVGGYLRNKLYQEFYNHKTLDEYKDIDLVINTNAIDFTLRVQKYLEDNDAQHETFDVVEKFDQFGTIKIFDDRYPKYNIELASTRTEIYDYPAAFPRVTIIDDFKEDLPRRDFTINALLESINPIKAKNPFGEIIDHVGGINDLQKGLIRVFHDDSFIDDPTRIYRAVRFMAEYNFKIEAKTLDLLNKATKHTDFRQWQEKRKARFKIELEKIEALGITKAKIAKDFLLNLGVVLLPTEA